MNHGSRIPITVTLMALLAMGVTAFGETPERPPRTLYYFYTPTCDKCMEVKAKVMPVIEQKFAGKVTVEHLDVGEPESYLKLFNLKQQYSADEKSVFPVIALDGSFLDRRDEGLLTVDGISKFIEGASAHPAQSATPSKAADKSDVVTYFKGLGLFAILAAGFADGMNPCSFAVIVFFMSYLLARGYDRRSIVVAGASFILASFIAYVCIGAGLAGFLHALRDFRAASAFLNIGIGVFSIALGLVSVYDAVKFSRTGDAESMILKLPKNMKDRIHGMIGGNYRFGRESATLLGLAAGTFVLGLTVSLFESICTGQLYLPTIMFVMKTTPYKLEALGKLLAYNLMFIAPLIAIYALALAGVTSSAFAGFMKRHLFLIKVAMALLFIALGATLVHAEEDKKVTSSAPVHFDQKAWPTKNDPNYWDFGNVKEGKLLKRRFFIVNTSREQFKITKVNTSCACTATKLNTHTVAPGRKVPIEIVFDTKGYPGERVRYIYAHTDSAKNPIVIFEIHANVIAKEASVKS